MLVFGGEFLPRRVCLKAEVPSQRADNSVLFAIRSAPQRNRTVSDRKGFVGDNQRR